MLGMDLPNVVEKMLKRIWPISASPHAWSITHFYNLQAKSYTCLFMDADELLSVGIVLFLHEDLYGMM